jgi:UDP-2,4-diacetamido-2,4,6-trideoxy-beta-L-altropyranose hydrolase
LEFRKNQQLFIRADATFQIGIGHLMRCIALAQKWMSSGGSVTFITHCESENLRQKICEEGFNLVRLKGSHPQSSDFETTCSIVNKSKQSWLILDGYHFTPDYQKAIRNTGIKLMIIDDYNHHPVYDVDFILNQNIGAEFFRYNCDSNATQLLGCDYTILRKEFRQYKQNKRVILQKANRIIVTMGGADPDNITLKVLNTLDLLGDSSLDVKIIAGPSNHNADSLRTAASQSLFNCEIYHDVEKMSVLMDWADLAIGAGGSTCWELAFMGVPSLIIIVDDNQEKIAHGLEEKGVIINLGWHSLLDEKECAEKIQGLLFDQNKRAIMSQQSKQIIDGTGVDRIVSMMQGFQT